MKYADPSILVLDDQRINAELVHTIIKRKRFNKWLKVLQVPAMQVDVYSSRSATSFAKLENANNTESWSQKETPLTDNNAAKFSAYVVDLKMSSGSFSSLEGKIAKELNALGYGGFAIIEQLERQGLLNRTIIHSANVANVVRDIDLLSAGKVKQDELTQYVKELVEKKGLTVCSKGSPAGIDLEIQLLATLGIELSFQLISPIAKKSLIRMAHKGIRSEKTQHALIIGKSGTGKEFTAKLLHALSGHYADMAREESVWRKIQLGVDDKTGIPEYSETLSIVTGSNIGSDNAESILYGTAGGKFTSVDSSWGILPCAVIHESNAIKKLTEDCFDKKIKSTEKVGVIFFDEFGDLARESQNSLLRVIQDGDFRRYGSSQTLTLKNEHGRLLIRIIAATSKTDIADIIKKPNKVGPEASVFRPDLLFRLGLPPLETPNLEQEQVVSLVRLFFQRRNSQIIAPLDTCNSSDQAIIERLKERVKEGYFPGHHRQFIDFLEQLASNAEERCVHREYFRKEAPRILIDDLNELIDLIQIQEKEASELTKYNSQRLQQFEFLRQLTGKSRSSVNARLPYFHFVIILSAVHEQNELAQFLGFSTPSTLNSTCKRYVSEIFPKRTDLTMTSPELRRAAFAILVARHIYADQKSSLYKGIQATLNEAKESIELKNAHNAKYKEKWLKCVIQNAHQKLESFPTNDVCSLATQVGDKISSYFPPQAGSS